MDVANWRERIRVLTDRVFDLAGLPTSPRNQAPYRVSNDLQRTLAHLAASDGVNSRLLRALESGVLRVSAEGYDEVPFSQGASGEIRSLMTNVSGVVVIDNPIGIPIVSPLFGAHQPAGEEVLSLGASGTTTHDFLSVDVRIVRVSCYGADIVVYDSDSSGGKDRARMLTGTFGVTDNAIHCRGRYLDFDNPGCDVYPAVITWWT